MIVRPKDDTRAIYHCSTFIPYEKRKRKDRKTTMALYTINLPPCIANKGKWKSKRLLFPHSLWNGIGQKTYIIMLVMTKGDICAIYHWSTSMHFEWGKRKSLLFPYSLWNGTEHKIIYHYACKAKRRQTRYIPLIYRHAFRIRKKEKGNVSFFLIAMTSRKFLRIKITPDLHLTYNKNGGNLGLVLKMKMIACTSILLTKHVKYTYLYLFKFVLCSIVAFKAN